MNSIVIAKVISRGSVLVLDTELGERFVPRDVEVRDEISVSRWPCLPSPQPVKNIFIQDLGDSRLALIRSIPVAIQTWSDHVSACSYDIEEFGIGADEFQAVEDLKASIVDLYFILKSEQSALGPLPQRQWTFLKGIIRES